MTASTTTLPKAFIWRRLHSLVGLWLVLFLIEHLLTNSQAALWLGDNGQGFVRMVNALHNVPYLQVIELVLIGVPLLIHLVWGVKYALQVKSNAKSSDGSKPSLPQYGRNRAFSWQRITSWILLIGIIGHVAKFRFLEYPLSVQQGSSYSYFVKVKMDQGLYTVADRLGVQLFDSSAIEKEQQKVSERDGQTALLQAAQEILKSDDPRAIEKYEEQKALILASAQKFEEKKAWVKQLSKKSLEPGEVIAVSNDFGTATLLSVRDVFKNPLYVVLYTLFVLAACFHAFNGLWTFMITWGWVIKRSAQLSMVTFCILLMALLSFLGLAAVWGTYWINLRY